MTVSKKGLAPTQNEQLPNLIVNPKSDTMLVDARSLHERLGVKEKFSDWMKRRISEYQLKDGIDYFRNFGNRSDDKAGKRRYEFSLTLDTAKELAMVERTAQGRAIRQYFIEAEKELRTKRLYGQKLNFSELGKQVATARINGTMLYAAREARGALGFNTRGSLTYWRNKFPGLIINYNGLLMASAEVIELWILKATLNGKQEYAKAVSENKPVLGKNFGQTILNF